ncbi:Membrane-anchored protein YidD, putatitve component of membrane protein insertase Oxa1/YidC/SpoIIIJ [Mycobacterium rhizamassiliense]|jgi:putative membrane protein insertion efficiency factor|uniref:Putative membrane protein insertion efficiency factor n=1 Tax=Mycobacterium rhizamassiliense TaxID=1841860 RepID=A0A2U3NR13_9MYCO|nr:membrane protein insertion efficiency factor YidD [Mycobacterium rhizamassiliense]SPM33855.1 Membrane-anchored protein YidD, putatitve component of membrane protein insertase Oxa1/YidC/SpoIIIJ [Mycobacterium rhizamassiliense]
MSVRSAIDGVGKTAVRGAVFLIQLYRHMVSPLRPATCRFIPTCSQYAVDALTEYGLIRGSWLAAARLAKCGPWHRGGWDPIPERECRSDFTAAGTDGELPANQGKSVSFVV